jgi:hypothetical protein
MGMKRASEAPWISNDFLRFKNPPKGFHFPSLREKAKKILKIPYIGMLL